MMSSWPADVEANNEKHGISVSCTRFDELLKDSSFWDWDTSFKQFHFLVRPLNQLNGKKDHKDSYKMERILKVSTSEVSAFRLKFCWIERCNNIKSIFDAEKLNCTAEPGENKNMVEDNVEFILVSNATKLESIVLGNLPGILKNLKSLHLDCCPKIVSLFPVSQQLENLEVLKIKFCDELKTLFADESVQLPKLQKLHLRALPNLKKVGCVAPNLVSLKVVDCPKLVEQLHNFINGFVYEVVELFTEMRNSGFQADEYS